MKPYNGFSETQRNKAQAWLNSQWAAGLLQKPFQCCSCGQTKGIIDAHAEDYSEPFAAGKTDQYHLCFRCHMALHCRFKNPKAFQRYCQAVESGKQYNPFYKRNFFVFVEQQLDAWNPQGETPYNKTSNVLATIHANIST